MTTAVYAKNKNIDLKRDWILTACVISMCAVGSVAAYFTHQQVLGGFSLFLCVAIGIRFLVKPNSGEKAEGKGTAKLNKFQIGISLFFGLTIGFGTGFFGSGGGFVLEAAGYHYSNAMRYAKEVGCKVVFPLYRLAPQHPFPVFFEDCYAAFTWAYDRAGELGIDIDRIGIGGDSAGSTLAAMKQRIAFMKRMIS
ncbi:MAG: alpha/beta hydrolase fold domain-containing protein [Oscillospiraceae bacterium]|nr:alpha/beta hydrolase fold domain-containing protein [Oscillospiraceae bacterium]MBR6608168.1 alpha/beta hydrolase fold domain-containing protein [Oscillospiraceae bacterium]